MTVSLSHQGMESQARNLAFYAGTAVAYGMDKEEALKTITSNTAKALGIDKASRYFGSRQGCNFICLRR